MMTAKNIKPPRLSIGEVKRVSEALELRESVLRMQEDLKKALEHNWAVELKLGSRGSVRWTVSKEFAAAVLEAAIDHNEKTLKPLEKYLSTRVDLSPEPEEAPAESKSPPPGTNGATTPEPNGKAEGAIV
jgi:hypothetical protein